MRAKRDIELYEGIAYITLPSGHVVTLDAEDVDRVNWKRLYYIRAFDSVIYYTESGHQRRLGCYLLGEGHSSVVQKNGDPFDYRKENLRPVIRQGSAAYLHKTVPQKYRGVYKHFKRDAYIAKVQHNGHVYYAGTYSDPETAAENYDLKAREVLGDHAVTNKDLGLL